MIPYEELVAALTRWRARRGLPTGLGDYLGEVAPAPFEPPTLAAPAGSGDVVDLGDELLDGMVDGSPHDYRYGDRELGGQMADGAGELAAGEAIDARDELLDSVDVVDYSAYGSHGSEESTKPAGLAGLAPPPEVVAEPVPLMEREPDASAGGDSDGDTKPVARGRSRGRRRRK
jgi:hypothetical protein